METTSTNRGWFTAKEAAQFIGVHIDTLYAYTKLRKKKPPFFKLSRDRRYRFPKEQFIKWASGSNAAEQQESKE
jgi:excisionase family DNA binding protein